MPGSEFSAIRSMAELNTADTSTVVSEFNINIAEVCKFCEGEVNGTLSAKGMKRCKT